MEVEVPARGGARTGLQVGIGACALLLRPFILGVPDATRIAALTALFAAVLVVSLLARVPTDRPRLAPALVLVVGLAGVALAVIAGGRPVASPMATAAIALALLAAVAEEALFRRAAYGWLERYGVWVAVLGSAFVFALIHVPLYGAAAFPVDLGAGLLLSWQRWASGTWTVPAATHAVANLLAVILR